MKGCAVFIFTLLAITGFSQNTLNNYKYVLVPERFDFAREDNQYGLNTTTKVLLEQKGFTAFVGNEELPLAVAANKCNALRVEVVQRRSLFVTNLTLLLKDCQGNVIFKSKEGKSREKEFPISFDLALKDAFSSLNDTPYKYDSTIFTQIKQVAATPVASSSAPIPVASAPAASTPATSTPPASAPATSASAAEITGTLYAQPIPNGYQLIDTSPKKVLTLLKTSVQDYFIAEDGASGGIVFKKNAAWFFECYKDGKLVSQKLEIKF